MVLFLVRYYPYRSTADNTTGPIFWHHNATPQHPFTQMWLYQPNRAFSFLIIHTNIIEPFIIKLILKEELGNRMIWLRKSVRKITYYNAVSTFSPGKSSDCGRIFGSDCSPQRYVLFTQTIHPVWMHIVNLYCNLPFLNFWPYQWVMKGFGWILNKAINAIDSALADLMFH